jgi:hypothetical protein
MSTLNRTVGATIVILSVAGGAWAQAKSCQPLYACDLPYIQSPGVFCLAEDVTVDISSGSAIEIHADDVVLDLDGHFILNSARDPGTSRGIRASDQDRITVRNGSVRGFERGVDIQTTRRSTGLHVLEDLHITACTQLGMYVHGAAALIRHNDVSDIGGVDTSNAHGISANSGTFRIVNNDVMGLSSSGYSFGISLNSDSPSMVVGNRISSADKAIHATTATLATCRDNLTADISVSSFSNCVDAGGNF